MSGSNRGFWKVVLPLVVGGILLVVLVLVFRPVARTGAVAYAQANLRAAEAAERPLPGRSRTRIGSGWRRRARSTTCC